METMAKSAGCFFLACALTMTLGACGGNNEAKQDEPVMDTPAPQVAVRDEAVPDAGGRIDATKTGVQVATFDGPKYIVSDATVDQSQEGNYGLQEICVVRPPESWSTAETIGWDRNSIAYGRIPTDWGFVSYRYEYINEAGTDSVQADWSRVSEDGFFGGAPNVEHTNVGDHQVAYILNDEAAGEVAPGIVDAGVAEEQASLGKIVTLFGLESRAEDCAFAISMSCELSKDAQVELSAEQLLGDAYAVLEFLGRDAQVDAASFESDVTISNAQGTHRVVVHRNEAALLSYTPHSVVMGNFGDPSAPGTLTFDYAPEGGLEGAARKAQSTDMFNPDFGYTNIEVSNVEQHDVAGRTFNACVVSANMDMGERGSEAMRELRAWCDVEGDALFVETTIAENEGVEDALTRILSDRLEFVE